MIDIKIDYAADDSCQIKLWAKGTHSPNEFLLACEKALYQWDKRNISLAGKLVANTHWRTVRADAETSSSGVCDYIRRESKPGRGAYAVTVLNEWLPLHVMNEMEESNA